VKHKLNLTVLFFHIALRFLAVVVSSIIKNNQDRLAGILM
jgi:hypothetical protein